MNIDGTRKNDWLEGARENDVFTGGAGRDTFVIREGAGDDVIADFQGGDRLLFDYSSYSDYMIFGRLHDGQTWQDFTGGTTFTVTALDANSDGITDTRIDVNDDSVTLLGLAPSQVSGWAISGG